MMISNLIETTLLLANSAILVTLRKELSTIPENATWTQREQLPYLSAVVEEENRLAFGVTAHTAWISYKPLTYSPSQFATNSSKFNKSYIIPGGTPVSAPTLHIHTAENILSESLHFRSRKMARRGWPYVVQVPDGIW